MKELSGAFASTALTSNTLSHQNQSYKIISDLDTSGFILSYDELISFPQDYKEALSDALYYECLKLCEHTTRVFLARQ